MSDIFSNWAHRGVEEVKNLSRRIQAGETPLQQQIKEQQALHQQQQHNMQVDKVELSNEGHMPKAKVNKHQMVFEASTSSHSSDRHQGEQQQHGGKDGQQRRSGKEHGQEGQAKAEKSKHAEAETPVKSHKDQSPAKADKTGTQSEGSHEKQAASHSEKTSAPKERGTGHGTEHQTAVERTSRPSNHVESQSQNVRESASINRPASAEPVVPRTQLSAQEYLKAVAKAGGFDHLSSNSFGHGGAPRDQFVGPKAPGAHPESGYVQLRGVPEHVKRAEAKRLEGGKTEGGKHEASTSEGQKGSTKETGRGHEGPQVKNQPARTEGQAPKTEAAKPSKPSAIEAHANGSAPEATLPNTKLDIRGAAGKLVGGGLGFLGIAGGISEAREGIQQIRNGQHVEGTLNVTAGASDVTSGTASLLYTIGRTGMGTIAAKAGGAGSILSGGAEIVQGTRNHDTEQQVEGGIKVTLGAGMFVAGRTSPLSASALAGWSGGRFIGSHVKIGGETIDQKVTTAMDAHNNAAVNKELQDISKHNMSMTSKADAMQGKDASEVQQQGFTRKDVTDAIIGRREEVEASVRNGNLDTQKQAELRRLMEMRSKMSQ